MALVVADRVKETTTTTGTGAITLAGAETNFVTFSSVLSNADTTYYAIVDNTNSAFEVGLGTYASSGNTITRTTIISSSNSNNAVDLQAGSKDVFVTLPSNKFPLLDASGNVDINGGTIDGTTIGGSSAAAGTFTTANATTVDTTNIEVTNIKAKDGTSAGSIADSTGVVTVASAVLTTADINGGTADNVTIGGSTAAAGTFTTFTSTGIDDNASSTAITITSGNDVGVGVTSPRTGYRLDVQESADNGVNIQAGNAASDIALAVGSASTADKVVIEAGGNVGIGGTPSGILHLKSDDNGMIFQSSSSSNSRAQIFFQNTGGTTTGKIAVDPDGSNANVMAFSTGSTERMRIDSSGDTNITGNVLAGASATAGVTAYAINYGGDDILNVFGSLRSSANTVLTYGAKPSTTVNGGYVSAADNFSFSKAALEIGGGTLEFKKSASATDTVGNAVTMTNVFSINTSGDTTFTGSVTTEGPDGGSVIRGWPGAPSTYSMFGTANMDSAEYAVLTDGANTFIAGGAGGSTRIRYANNQTDKQIEVSSAGTTITGGAIDGATSDHFLLPNANNSEVPNSSTSRNGGAINYIYNRSSNLTLTRGDFAHHIIQQWSHGPTFTLTSSTFQRGDIVEVINVKGAVTITVVGTIIYLPDGSNDTTLTLSQAGKFRLIRYSSNAGYWMVG